MRLRVQALLALQSLILSTSHRGKSAVAPRRKALVLLGSCYAKYFYCFFALRLKVLHRHHVVPKLESRVRAALPRTL